MVFAGGQVPSNHKDTAMGKNPTDANAQDATTQVEKPAPKAFAGLFPGGAIPPGDMEPYEVADMLAEQALKDAKGGGT
jgi:hypothetical protein